MRCSGSDFAAPLFRSHDSVTDSFRLASDNSLAFNEGNIRLFQARIKQSSASLNTIRKRDRRNFADRIGSLHKSPKITSLPPHYSDAKGA